MTVVEKEVSQRRTFAIISHPDAGKTTLTEKLHTSLSQHMALQGQLSHYKEASFQAQNRVCLLESDIHRMQQENLQLKAQCKEIELQSLSTAQNVQSNNAKIADLEQMCQTLTLKLVSTEGKAAELALVSSRLNGLQAQHDK